MGEEYLTLTLERGDKGLGFNIKGGTDNPYIPKDSGIFISKIKQDGAAAKDGRLKVGHKVIEVNGKSLLNITHNAAVDIFLTAGDIVNMTVQNISNSKKIVKKEPELKSCFSYQIILPIAVGFALVSAFYLYRTKYA